ncbi:Arabinanase/levansucrase/invertase [Meira miltonrushii]|uniref:Arabinanase/levansucrase/invertase n=1 Tax=Meira miltonrushii TaxID=1280837 RepID=A0A316VCL6_9BASI|nr:Arabinanase/levansucrase/invertase [Meira miltonrushii]PWN35044.1 Arabinanase/levansucrase/invertase [Meira miltonrushii]
MHCYRPTQSFCQAILLCIAFIRLANCYGRIINPIGHHADPQPISRIQDDGKRWYYFPSANGSEAEVNMFASTNLNDVYSTNAPWNRHSIFNFTKNDQQNPEAPAMFKWNETNYVMYVSSNGPTGNRIYALHNDGRDLTSGWTFAGVVSYSDGTTLIGYDAFALSHPNGNKYLFYTNTTTIFVNKLLPDYGFATLQPKQGGNGTIVASRVELPFTEAPAVLISGDKLNFLYSQNSFFSPNYTTYNIPVSTDADPLDPDTWSKPKPVQVLASSEKNGVYGTGSVGAFTGPDGKPWLAYTCFYQQKAFDRYTSDPRYVQVQPLHLMNDEIQPLIPVKPGHKMQKAQNDAYIPRYTNLDLRFFKKPPVREGK